MCLIYLIFICLDAAESPPPLEREERASQPLLGLQAVGGSHLHLLQRACWLVLNGNTCQMLLQTFCRIEREEERERETMGSMAAMCHQITRDDQQDDDADADDVVLVDLLKFLRSETGALNDQSIFYSLLVGEMIFIFYFFVLASSVFVLRFSLFLMNLGVGVLQQRAECSSSSHAWVKCWQLLQQL